MATVLCQVLYTGTYNTNLYTKYKLTGHGNRKKNINIELPIRKILLNSDYTSIQSSEDIDSLQT